MFLITLYNMGVSNTTIIKSRRNHKGVFMGKVELDTFIAISVPTGTELNCPLYIQKQDNKLGNVKSNSVSVYDKYSLKQGSVLTIISNMAIAFQIR